MPEAVRHSIGLELMRVQFGGEPTRFKPMSTVGAYRPIYVAKFEAAVYVLHAFHKKTRQTAKRDIKLTKARYKLIEGTS